MEMKLEDLDIDDVGLDEDITPEAEFDEDGLMVLYHKERKFMRMSRLTSQPRTTSSLPY